MSHTYAYQQQRYVENCDFCDEFTECDEYARSDGKTCSICLACTDELEAMNKIRNFRVI